MLSSEGELSSDEDGDADAARESVCVVESGSEAPGSAVSVSDEAADATAVDASLSGDEDGSVASIGRREP
jgi:hypothetical protein